MIKNTMKGWLAGLAGLAFSSSADPSGFSFGGSHGVESQGCQSKVNAGFKRNRRISLARRH